MASEDVYCMHPAKWHTDLRTATTDVITYVVVKQKRKKHHMTQTKVYNLYRFYLSVKEQKY